MRFQLLVTILVLQGLVACSPESSDSTVIIVPTPGSDMAIVESDGQVTAPDSDVGTPIESDVGTPIEPDMFVEPPEPILVPEFGRSAERRILPQAHRSDGLSHPRDLAFNPDAPANLWVVDRDWDGNVVLFDAGTESQRIDRMRDMAASHFMEEVSSIAFSDRGSFGTCQESRNDFDGFAFPNDFMGPVLWSTDLRIHCTVNQREGGMLNGSHLDMLHQSPLCMGMAHQTSHAFFVADGANGHVVRYDFQQPHVPGGDDHSDGIVSRYPELTFTRIPDIPSHMVMMGNDLYYVDSGAGAVRVADVSTGAPAGRLFADNEPLELFNQIQGVTHRVLIDGLDTPSGLLIANERIFVSFPKTGEIAAYGMDGVEIERIQTGAAGVMGLAMGPQGRIWFVNAYEGSVSVIEPGPMEMVDPAPIDPPQMGECVYPEWSARPSVGDVLPPFQWSSAFNGAQNMGPFGALDMHCGADWQDVETIVFVVFPEWIPWLFEYVAYVDALAPQIENAGGRVVFVGAQDAGGAMLSQQQMNRILSEVAPGGNGIRVTEADNTFSTKLINTGLIDHLPSAFVVRRSDMKVLATQRTRGGEHLPYVEMTQDPDADWSNPGPATIRPTLPSNCPEGADEDSEPNDTPEQAATIGAGRIRGGICNRRGDFYYVDIDGDWSFNLEFTHAVGDLDVILFRDGQPLIDRTGQPVGPNSSTDNESFEWEGPVMVFILGYDGATAPYRLTISEL